MISEHIHKQFKFLRKTDYIYLDNAATTQTHQTVVQAVRDSLEYSGNPSRSAHNPAAQNEKKITKATEKIADFIGADPSEIGFRSNTTDAINTAVHAIKHIFSAGDEIVVPVSEHHSNLLPYSQLQDDGVKIKLVEVDEVGNIDTEDLKQKLTENTKFVAFSHASNVFGNKQPAEKITQIVKNYNEETLVLVDGAQAIAHTPVDMKDIGCDFYAFAGHKMYGPDGISVLYVNEEIHPDIAATSTGGGTVKDVSTVSQDEYTTITPEYTTVADKLSGGTKNVAGIIGLGNAVELLDEKLGLETISNHEKKLMSYALDQLADIDIVEIVGTNNSEKRLGLVSIKLEDLDVNDAAEFLAKKDICVRAGTHCAIPLSEHIGAATLRVSFGVYNTTEDIDAFVNTLERFIDIQSGSYTNPRFHEFADKDYTRKTEKVSSVSDIEKLISGHIQNKDESEVSIMAGHAIGIPSYQDNRFYPSIPELMTPETKPLLSEFSMDNFSNQSFAIGSFLARKLKESDIGTQINTLFNDTTGINELYKSSHNTTDKTAEEYRKELLNSFAKEKGDLPGVYKETLKKYGLSIDDLMLNETSTYFTETKIRKRFKKFIRKNQETFRGLVDYRIDNENEEFDLEINILDNPAIKACRFDMFSSKTGGIFCTAEVCQYIAEMIGVDPEISYDYMPERITSPQITTNSPVVVMLTPAMCDDAIIRGAELYRKLFVADNPSKHFTFINIPFGPTPNDDLESGVSARVISA